jgi:hypothetical protein
MKMEMDRLLSSIGRDAETCATHVYTYLTFGHFVRTRPLFLDSLNRDPTFWNAHTYAHLTAAFVSLGRLYETNSDHDTLASLLAFVQRNLHLFTHESLATRKKLAGMASEQAKRFVKDTFVADETTFSDVRRSCAQARSIYISKAKPIRDKVFAHTAKTNGVDLDFLYKDFLTGDFENLAVLPLRLHRAIFHLYHDGIQPILQDAPTQIEAVLTSRPGKHHSTWHHLHVAADTAAFIERFCAHPIV